VESDLPVVFRVGGSRELADGFDDFCELFVMNAHPGLKFGQLFGECLLVEHKAAKARITTRLIFTARGLLRTVAAMRAPCSVKTQGIFRSPPRLGFDVANCDIKGLSSSRVS
jgi:hypothetical protein